MSRNLFCGSLHSVESHDSLTPIRLGERMKRRGFNRASLVNAVVKSGLTDLLPAEFVHTTAVTAVERGWAKPAVRYLDSSLSTRVWGLSFENPLGSCAGFDKYAQLPKRLFEIGFGYAEVGTITPLPQEGNPKPRLFRLSKDRALINRMGFNNPGLDNAITELENGRAAGRYSGPVGLNVGANKDSKDRIEDYVLCIKRAAHVSDYFVVNISSPNTPGLRDLQQKANLAQLFSRVLEARNETAPPDRFIPLLVKISPDVSHGELCDIAETVLSFRVDGVILTNTTVGCRDTLQSKRRVQNGGLSGVPLFEKSTRILAQFYNLTNGRVPLVGVGGIDSGERAYTKIKAGASLLQLYTALAFRGTEVVQNVLIDLASLLKRDGFAHIQEAIGIESKMYGASEPPMTGAGTHLYAAE